MTTPFEYLAPVPTSNGEMKTIYGHVRYDVELTTVCGYLICRNIYTLHPEGIEYFSKIQTDRDSGKIPSNLIKRTHWRSAGDTFRVYFEEGSNDGGCISQPPSLSALEKVLPSASAVPSIRTEKPVVVGQ